MWAQLTPWLKEQGRRLGPALALLAVLFAQVVATGWRLVRPSLVFALNVLAALVLLFEEWGWRPLSNFVAWLARFPLFAAGERWIAGLPPYGALVTLGVPSTIVIPTKLIGVYLLATGHILTAAVVIICAKVIGTALVARIFVLTKPQLMQIGWFKSSFEAFVPWQEALFARIRNSWVWRYGRVLRWRTKGFVRRAWERLRPELDAAWSDMKPRAIAWRRRMQAAARSASERVAVKGEELLRRLQGPEA